MSSVRRSALVLSAIFVCANAAALLWRPASAARAETAMAITVPEKVGPFVSQGDVPMPPEVKEALASATMIARSYSGGGPLPLDFILIGGTDRSALHDPRSCLVGDGWRITEDRSETLAGAGIPVRTCRIVKGGEGDGQPAAAYEMLYLYVVDGQVVERVTQIRGRMLAAALLGSKGAPTYFLRFVRPLSADEPGAGSENATAEPPSEDGGLRRFAAAMWSEISPKMVTAK
jgi:hypothetical protein